MNFIPGLIISLYLFPSSNFSFWENEKIPMGNNNNSKTPINQLNTGIDPNGSWTFSPCNALKKEGNIDTFPRPDLINSTIFFAKNKNEHCVIDTIFCYNEELDSVTCVSFQIDQEKIIEDDSIKTEDIYTKDTIYVIKPSICLNTLIDQLKSFTAPIEDTQEKIDFILKFINNIFLYTRDEDLYGQEKFLSPESYLYKRRGDCDDQAILFGYLMKSVLGIDAIWIEHPSLIHVNCGILKCLVKNRSTNTTIQFQNQDYIIIEPYLYFQKKQILKYDLSNIKIKTMRIIDKEELK